MSYYIVAALTISAGSQVSFALGAQLINFYPLSVALTSQGTFLITSDIDFSVGQQLSTALGNVMLQSYPAAVVRANTIAPQSPSSLPVLQYASLGPTPAGSATGTPLFANGVPAAIDGVTFILQPGASISFTIATAQPTSPPPSADIVTLMGPSSGSAPSVASIALTLGQNLYITAGGALVLSGTDAIDVSASGSGGSGSAYATSSSAALSSVAASTSSTAILAANAARKSFSVYNESSAIMYLAAGTSASTTAYSTQIGPQQLFESSIDYEGPYSAVWATATGSARITEYV